MTRILRLALYRERLTATRAAAISIDTHRLTRRWRAWVRPLDQRAFVPVTAVQLDAVQWCRTPAEVRVLIGGGA